ncbi:MAG TPA: hypothetical protein VGG03_18805 [Thermoanaerobaculia bacterium]|jgi:hypothetical protein
MSGRRDLLHLAGACLLLTLGIWVNTGTLAPLGATLEHPLVWEPCKYLLNIDHFHSKAAFLMLDGAPREQWEFSVTLRRILHPLLAYPLMKLLGFGGGGLVANVLLSAGALAAFWIPLQRRYHGRVPAAILYLIATYPGWFYWAGLPYAYAAIVPASLLCLVLLWRLESLATWRQAVPVGLGLGVLFTAYDLLPFFGPAAVLLLLWRRRWALCAVLAATQVVPTILVQLSLSRLYAVPLRNSNSEVYLQILDSYLPPYDWPGWGSLLALLPKVLVDSFFFSNFLFLPVLFLIGLAASRWLPRERRSRRPAEACVLLAAVLLFVFNNAAPPYLGWQMRGFWIARLYQPVVAALVSLLAGLYADAPLLPRPVRVGSWAALLLTIALNSWVVFAPVLGHAQLSGFLHFRFYRHAPRPLYAENLRKFGARPVGFCASPPISRESVTH